MGVKNALQNIDKVDAVIEPMLRAARIPGAAIAIVAGSETVFAKGYGYRSLEAKLPVTSETAYPIASTTKAINATLLGMLVDEGRLGWDIPVQQYLPRFRLRDPLVSAQVTVRDLLMMRTGLPRHDWLWIENPMSRAQLVECLRHLEFSAGFRERFQYNNMTATTAGHVAEVVTGRSWEDLVQQKLLGPLSMSTTGFTLPTGHNVTLSYHENNSRTLLVTERFAQEVTAPSGGAIYSNVEDMARWIAFNLSGGKVKERALIDAQTLSTIHSPQMVVGVDPSAPAPNATYAMGWFAYSYNGCACLSHGGYIHDVNSELTVFPEMDVGIVSFINFGFPALARLINQHTFDLLMGFAPEHTLADKLAQYERKIVENRQRIASVRRAEHTLPSHPVTDYVGVYAHPGYGSIEIQLNEAELVFLRNNLVLPLQHWHYDAWVAKDIGIFSIHAPNAFDWESRFLFETNVDGTIAAVSIRLEPAVAAIRFERL